ncbi:hypothetical protein [Microbulbifer pacificus]|uniref:GTPase n=1 Tax=Microbulbifer pacificus TaxID=407164 RepID=A0AAU0MUK6_9GAMM|nr:hypothetical protein [Microbulbifer pacificus]WOX04264.1 hypothetical protein R5R33_10970 [Microbulbifer pacificus]
MQDAAELEIGHRAHPGSDASGTSETNIDDRARADSTGIDTDPDSVAAAHVSRTDQPAQSVGGKAARAPSAQEKLATGPRDLTALTCGCRNHRQLRRWIDSLLQQNPIDGKAQRNAGTLRSLLAEITRWNAPARLRLASLEVLRPIVAAHCDALTRATADSGGSGPHPQEQRRDLLIAAILFQHQALAYTSVCLQLVSEEPHTLFFRRHLARALHRGIDSYRSLVQISSHFYLATPKSGWSRMQQLVQLAREQQLDQRRVLDPLARTRASANRFTRGEKVIQPYLQSALFASANPLQLTVEDQRQLWSCCARWASGARLQDQINPAVRSLLANLRLDQAPIPAVRLQHTRVDLKHFTAPFGWSIDLTAPLRQLQRRLRRPGKLSPDLLSRVQGLWAGEKGRSDQRTPVDIRCEVILGISAICHHLKQGDEVAPELVAAFDTRDSASRSKNLVMEVGSIDFHTGRALKDYEVSVPDAYSSALPSAPSTARQTDNARVQKRYQPIPATLLNTSDNGAGLRLPPDIQGRLHSGDLIAVQVKERWEVALVRWHYGLPDQCRVGVELLGGYTSAVRVHRYTKDGRRTGPMAGLLTGNAGLPPELVLPTPLFQSGDSVDIVAAGQTRNVTLHQRSMTTGSIAIFEFS